MLKAKLITAVALLFLFSCENYSQNSLASDQASLVKCPANGCASALADSNELNISWLGKSTVVVSNALDKSVQLGGDCYPSTYFNNRIDVQVRNAATNQAVAAKPYSLNLTSPDTIRCEKGRYNIFFETASLPANNVYRVSLTLVGLENNSQFTGGVNTAVLSISR